MKLSMWMIANQMLDLDPELEIAEDAPAVLNSARLAYATNCVYIYKEGDKIICNGEGNIIKLQNLEIHYVLELVQAIFDAYEDWLDIILRQIRQHDYEGMILTAHKMFRNPLVLLDANNKVLGMTRQYDEHSMDMEWAYLYRYGYSSLNALNLIRHSAGNTNFFDHGQQTFHFAPNNLLRYSGLSTSMYFNGILCGRLNLLSKERALNPGDTQLADALCKILEPRLGQLFFQSVVNNSSNVFLNVFLGKSYDFKILQMQMNYQKWDMEDTFYVAMIRLQAPEDESRSQNHLNALYQTVSQHISKSPIIIQKPYLLILSTDNLAEDPFSRDFLQKLAENNPIQIGFSLPAKGLLNTRQLYQQAKYAISYGSSQNPAGKLFAFRDYAADFLLLSGAALSDKLFACMPEVVAMWNLKREKKDELFQSLKVFLDCERSIAHTASALFLHRNTAVYRIKKIQNFLNRDLDDPKVRLYCRLSIYILELYEAANPEFNPK